MLHHDHNIGAELYRIQEWKTGSNTIISSMCYKEKSWYTRKLP